MNRAYEEAFVEIDEILKIIPVDLLTKIPLQFRKIISEKKAKNYKIEIKEPLDENSLKKETVVIMGLIYRDFLASPEERDELKTQDAKELQRIEEQMKQQDNIENSYSKEITDLVLYKPKGFFKKAFNFIKVLFSKNKILKKV